MCSVTVRESGGDALLILGIRRVSQMKKKSRDLALLLRRKRRNAVLNVFHAHAGRDNGSFATEQVRRSAPTGWLGALCKATSIYAKEGVRVPAVREARLARPASARLRAVTGGLRIPRGAHASRVSNSASRRVAESEGRWRRASRAVSSAPAERPSAPEPLSTKTKNGPSIFHHSSRQLASLSPGEGRTSSMTLEHRLRLILRALQEICSIIRLEVHRGA